MLFSGKRHLDDVKKGSSVTKLQVGFVVLCFERMENLFGRREELIIKMLEKRILKSFVLLDLNFYG